MLQYIFDPRSKKNMQAVSPLPYEVPLFKDILPERNLKTPSHSKTNSNH